MKTDSKRTVYISATELEIVEYNPRNYSLKRLRQLANSIKGDKQFFEARPCLVNLREDDRLVVYAGCLRCQAAVEILKWKEIPCIVESISSDLEKRRNLLDNAHAGNFDELMLRDLGFSNDELKQLFLDEFAFASEHSDRDTQSQAGSDQALVYRVVITCQDEIQQTQLIKELEEKGFDCKVLIS